MRRLFDSWSTPAPTRPAARGSSSSTVGRVQSIALSDSRAVGSVRGDRGRDPARPAADAVPAFRDAAETCRSAARSAVERPGPDGLADRRLVRRGAGSSRMLRAAASSSAVAIGTATGGLAAAAAAAFAARRPPAARVSAAVASLARRIESAVVEPTQRAAPVNGAMSSRSWRLNASISPRPATAASSTNVPGPVSNGSSVPARNRPIRPPPRSVSNSSILSTSNAPRAAMYAIASPAMVIPQPDPGARPGPPATYQPPPSSRNGSSQRPVSNQGAIESRHQSVSAPCPGRISAISVIAPSAIIAVPTIERTTSGVKIRATSRRKRRCVERPRGARPAARGLVRRALATVRPRPRPGRPSGGAWSARTGSSIPRP